ncbi:MAG: tetratricopeptide repeat protein [Cyanobacteria bacterium]|nr:tetratricopeptide repeat protein [Cyanobacteriota bacterium]
MIKPVCWIGLLFSIFLTSSPLTLAKIPERLPNTTDPNQLCSLFFRGSEEDRIKAINACKTLIQRNPKNVRALTVLADHYSNDAIGFNDTNEFNESILMARRALLYEPKNARAHYIIGVNYLCLNKNREAIQELELSSQLDSTDPQTFEWLMRAYQTAKLPQKIIDYVLGLEKKKSPLTYNQYEALADAYQYIGNLDQAIKYQQQTLLAFNQARKSEYYDGILNLGMLYERHQEYAKALAQYQKALKLDSNRYGKSEINQKIKALQKKLKA